MAPSIPIIDVAPAFADDEHLSVIREIRDALRDVGFLQIVGHGVEPRLFDEMYAAKDELIALPEETKCSLKSQTHPFRGWTRHRDAEGRTTSERFQVCNLDDASAALAAGVDPRWQDYFHANIWPEIPTFRPTLRRYFDATRKVGAALMSLFAEALELEPDYFEPLFQQDVTCFALNVYPGEHRSLLASEPTVVLPAHGDSGALTILHQRGQYAGLQVQQCSGEWLTVPIIDEALVINVGELMAHWTNDLWAATSHRVVAATDEDKTRSSLTTFYLPGVNTLIAPLPTCVDGEAHYEPVTPYEWEGRYLARQYERVSGSYVRRVDSERRPMRVG